MGRFETLTPEQLAAAKGPAAMTAPDAAPAAAGTPAPVPQTSAGTK
jgi:hypothetical protein